jgi:glyoxylate carboligase
MINNGYMGLIRQAEKNYDMKPVTERLPEPLATFPEPVG